MEKGTLTRLTLDQLPAHIPTPQELYDELITSKGWPYSTQNPKQAEFFHTRDLSLPSLLYLGALRVSEAIPIIKNQFSEPTKDERGKHILLKDVRLAKRREGKIETNNLELPLIGERAKFTILIQNYLKLLEPNDRLFPWSIEKQRRTIKGKQGTYQNRKGETIQRYSVRLAGTSRAYQIVKVLLPNITEHWLRAFGEDFFYVLSGKDLVATAAHYKVDARTLANWYLKRRHLEVIIR
jgi:hypothetical protein